MPQKSVRAPHSLCKSLYFKGFLCHTTPHFMAYFGVIFFANMGGGGGRNCFQCVARQGGYPQWCATYKTSSLATESRQSLCPKGSFEAKKKSIDLTTPRPATE